MSVREGYKQTEIGVIPEEWEVKPLAEIAELTSSKRVHLADYVDKGIPFYRGKEITLLKDNKPIDDLLYISDEQYEEIRSKYGVPKEDDILITAVGTLANIYRVSDNDKFYFKDGNLIWLRNVSEASIYIDYCLSYNKKLLLNTAIGSSQKALTIVELKKVKLPLPPLPEQQKIATILSSVDRKIEAIDERIAQTEMLKKGLMQKLLRDGIGHTEFKESEIGRIPKEWEVVRLGEIADINKEKYTPSDNKVLKYIGLEHIEQNTGQLLDIGNSNETMSTKNKFSRGDILFGKLRPYLRKYWLATFDGVCSTEIISFRANTKIDRTFLFNIIRTDNFIEHTTSKMFGTKMPRTNWETIKSYKFALPLIEEQKQIAKILSATDAKLDTLREKKSRYEQLKKGLMQKLLTGEVRVKEAHNE